MLKGAIFDHDGLMFDTEKIWQKNWQKVASSMGIVLPEEFKHDICGSSGALMNAVVRKYFGVKDGSEIIEKVVAGVHADEAFSIDEKPGLREILEMFKRHGVIMAVASSSPEEMIRKNIEKAGLSGYFKALVSGQHVAHGKPAPDIFLLAAEKIGIDPKDCYVFEDAFNGVNAGAAAGCCTIMIPDMAQPDEEIRKKADAVYGSLLEACDAIENEKIGK
jgi:beta-phosphoglucomutase-like phosphatase (HAD superfamily)